MFYVDTHIFPLANVKKKPTYAALMSPGRLLYNQSHAASKDLRILIRKKQTKKYDP
jgi:hypothetical protein